ncbi:ExbD/TolR family protein [Psittacicella hinzii]|uniref:Outer membrane transport energization protein ExbD n=1 Tax=Psittacicella hinzii TaxID=2028575 RepID=A0A3A1YG53_9GAMM|nr:biopolymer transporter ExbD [Psittacicella hinzii]RIY37122.1 hypothetical protein CKF58_05350 [Psittacicella hinzii]
MAFGGFNSQDEEMSEINITPLVDVMLVLLIVFMLAMPVFTSSINVNLPKSTAQKMLEAPQIVNLVVNEQGVYFYQDGEVNLETLQQRLSEGFAKNDKLVVTIRADKKVSYEYVANLLELVRKVGISKIGFVAEPQAANAK